MAKSESVIVACNRPGYRQCGRSWSGSTLCEVREFPVPGLSSNYDPALFCDRPEPDPKSGAVYVLHPAELHHLEKHAKLGHYPLAVRPVNESDVEASRKVAELSVLDRQLAAKQADVAAMDARLAEAQEALHAAELRAEKAEKATAKAEKKLAAAEKALADADRKARS